MQLPRAQEYLRLVIFRRLTADIDCRRFGNGRGCARLNCTSSSGHIGTAITEFIASLAVSNGFSYSFRLNAETTDRVTLNENIYFFND